MNLSTLWEKAQDDIRTKVGKPSYDTWFSTIQVKEKDAQTIVIETPDDFFKNWIVDHYQIFIEDILNGLAPTKVHVEYSVNTELLKQGSQSRLAKLERALPEPRAAQTNLNARFTFENFVIGPSNRFACAACLAVSDSPAKAYNPLFIYGDVGLGKTHLIQSITHRTNKLFPHMKICYLSSEQFTNELIEAIRHRSTAEFRKRYREMDVLLIDDIQFIAGKESTQEEFFHTFNYLHDNRKQIIITSDRPPKDISNLEERLRSRFAWGLITDIQLPDYETRAAILRKKTEREGLRVPDDVINFIAAEIKTNIRELEGALVRVAAYSLLEDKVVTLDLTKRILKDMVQSATKPLNATDIQKAVAQYFQLSLMELRSPRRSKNIVLARQVAMYIAREQANMSFPEIGNAFGGKDHTTVLHSCKKIERELQTDIELKKAIEYIINNL